MKVRLRKLYSLPCRILEPAVYGVKHDVVYDCIPKSNEHGEFFQLEGQDACLPAECFEVIEEDPKPAILRSSNETPDDILEWYGNECPDPTVEMSKEIHMLRGALHDLKNEVNGKIGSAIAIVDLGRVYQDRIETLMKAFNKGED